MKSNISREEEMAIELLKKYILSWREIDVYDEKKKKDIDQMYAFFKENCKPNCSSDIIDIGYCLSDIYDKQSEYEKSLEITRQILFCFELSMAKEELIYDKNYIREVIGCAYGMAIAEVKSHADKIDLFEQSKKLFRKAKELCDNYSNSVFSRFYDKEFLWWLYHSDYGTFWVHKGDVYKKEKKNKKAEQAYNRALNEYKLSSEYRKKVLKAADENDNVVNETKNVIARNTNNTAIELFRLGRYEDSIKEHKDALNIFIELQDKERENLTKKYIIEGTIKLWENNHGDLHHEDIKICKNYLQDLLNYDVKGIEDMCKKLKEIEDSFHGE